MKGDVPGCGTVPTTSARQLNAATESLPVPHRPGLESTHTRSITSSTMVHFTQSSLARAQLRHGRNFNTSNGFLRSRNLSNPPRHLIPTINSTGSRLSSLGQRRVSCLRNRLVHSKLVTLDLVLRKKKKKKNLDSFIPPPPILFHPNGKVFSVGLFFQPLCSVVSSMVQVRTTTQTRS